MVQTREVIVSCPDCKQMDFLTIIGSSIDLSHHYHRDNGSIYHRDCPNPCHLFQMYLNPINNNSANPIPRNNNRRRFTKVCKANRPVSTTKRMEVDNEEVS